MYHKECLEGGMGHAHIICQMFSSGIKTHVISIPVPLLLSTSGTLNHVDTRNHVSSRSQDPQSSGEASGNSILQHREAMEATVKTFYQLILTGGPY